jgi:hypothetical protein
MTAFFKNDSFQFAVENALGEGYHRATDVGEVLATISRIPNGDAAASVREWSAAGDRLPGLAGAVGPTSILRGSPSSGSARAGSGFPAPWPTSTAWLRPSPIPGWSTRPPVRDPDREAHLPDHPPAVHRDRGRGRALRAPRPRPARGADPRLARRARPRVTRLTRRPQLRPPGRAVHPTPCGNSPQGVVRVRGSGR